MGKKTGKKHREKMEAIYDAVMTKRHKGAKGHASIKRDKKQAIDKARNMP